EMDIDENESQIVSKESSDNYSDNEMPDSQEISIQVPQNVQNPNHVKGKRRPPKSRFKSSIEKQSRKEKSSRGTYKCGQCGELDHNAAYHKRKK
ncbi:10156_t:CDS:1, partial [Gigaspora rosea]